MTSAMREGRPLERIMLIEDNAADAELVQVRLRNEYEVIHAPSFTHGLIMLEEVRVSAVLLDLGLPDTQGNSGVRMLCERHPALPIVVVTGVDDDGRGAQAVRE